MSKTVYAKLFRTHDIFNQHFERVCEHNPVHVSTYDGTSLEKICLQCGIVFPLVPSPIDKLDRCADLEEFRQVRYGPGTPEALQKFLLPTIAHGVKCRDKFIDKAHLDMTRKFTDIQRVCQRHGIPNDYAVETMRLLMKSGKVYSEYKPIEILIRLVEDSPSLKNRVRLLKKLTREGVLLEKYRQEVKTLRKQLEGNKK